MTQETLTAADLRRQLATGERSFRGRGRRRLPDHVLDAAASVVAREEVAKRSTPRGSGGKKTVVDGITFPSRTEARVYLRLKTEATAGGWILFRQVSYPLTNLAPKDDRGIPLRIRIDFELFHPPTGRRRFIDAKAKRWKSPEWTRGKAAFEARYGHLIEECER